jgi:hypothetical protein
MDLVKEEKNNKLYYKATKGEKILDIGRIENLPSKEWKELERKLMDFGGKELLDLVKAEVKKQPRIENIDIEPPTSTDDVAL